MITLLLIIGFSAAMFSAGMRHGRRLYQIDLRVAANRGEDLAEIVRSGE